MTAVGLFRSGPSWQPGLTLHDHPRLAEHREYVSTLERDGTLEAAGPLQSLDERPLRGELVGLVVFSDSDVGRARSMLTSDPAVAAGVLTVEVLPWLR